MTFALDDRREFESRRLRHLLAEDNEVNQKFAVRSHTKTGHTVGFATKGQEAGEKWAFDAVRMNIQGRSWTDTMQPQSTATGAER